MFLIQIGQRPVIVQYGDEKLQLQKFTLNDIISWGTSILESRIERDTATMDPVQKREFLHFYPPIPPTMQEMKQLVRTPMGISHVVATCLGHAGLTPDQIRGFIKDAGTGRCAMIAWELSDLEENLGYKNQPTKDEDSADPLTSTGKTGSPK